VQLSINDNSILWLLRAYTTNFVSAPSTTTWGYQYGGLVSTTTTSGNHVAMGWQCSTSPVAPVCGDPQYSPTNGWTYMKDVWDVNPPGVSNESFVYAVGAGYCNIAYGSASYTRVVNPTNANGLPLASPSGNFYLFTEADFSNPSNDSYTFNLVLELIHQ
jgi:hypothetical protein